MNSPSSIPVTAKDVTTYGDWMSALGTPGTMITNPRSHTVRTVIGGMNARLMARIAQTRQGQEGRQETVFTTMPAPIPHEKNLYYLTVPSSGDRVPEVDGGRSIHTNFSRAIRLCEGWRLAPAVKEAVNALGVRAGSTMKVDFNRPFSDTGREHVEAVPDLFGNLDEAATVAGEAARRSVYALIGLEISKHVALKELVADPDMLGTSTKSVMPLHPMYPVLRHIAHDPATVTPGDLLKRIAGHVSFLDTRATR